LISQHPSSSKSSLKVGWPKTHPITATSLREIAVRQAANEVMTPPHSPHQNVAPWISRWPSPWTRSVSCQNRPVPLRHACSTGGSIRRSINRSWSARRPGGVGWCWLEVGPKTRASPGESDFQGLFLFARDACILRPQRRCRCARLCPFQSTPRLKAWG